LFYQKDYEKFDAFFGGVTMSQGHETGRKDDLQAHEPNLR